VTLNEPVSGLTAQDVVTPVPHPLGMVWSPQTFDAIEIYPPGKTNARGDQTSYRLIPQPNGGLAHHNEAFTQADLWATLGNPLELDASRLPHYASESGSLVNTTVTTWYRGSVHHQPSDENGFYDDSGVWRGTTHTMWTSFIFVPRNLYSETPFFP